MQANDGFIPGDFQCEVCGQVDLVPSKIILECNYGSQYDGDKLTLEVCGRCMDKIMGFVLGSFLRAN